MKLKICRFNMGKKLIYRYGCMNSGKSMFLLATAHNLESQGLPFICLKSSLDTRNGEDVIFSRILPSRECISVDTETNIFNAVQKIIELREVAFEGGLKWILVDEAQFLTSNQVDQLARIVDELNVSVICYGLRTDFKSQLFPGSERLFAIADTIEEIKSTCACGNKNIVNPRIDENGKILLEGEQVLVGAEDLYQPMCRKCYNRKIREQNVG